jgi:Rod binding domain-containing protein
MLLNDAISAQPAMLLAKNSSGKILDPQRVEASAKDFEALFISQMVEQMFGESGGESAFGSGESDEVYKSLMVQEYGKMITKSGGIGIADYVKRELLKQQEM